MGRPHARVHGGAFTAVRSRRCGDERGWRRWRRSRHLDVLIAAVGWLVHLASDARVEQEVEMGVFGRHILIEHARQQVLRSLHLARPHARAQQRGVGEGTDGEALVLHAPQLREGHLKRRGRAHVEREPLLRARRASVGCAGSGCRLMSGSMRS